MPGNGLVPRFHGRHGGPDHTGRVGRTWILWTLELGAPSEAVELMLEGPPDNCRLRWPRENLCLEVNCRKMEAGNMIFLWNDDPPVPAAAHSTFVFNDDGSISPHQHCPGKNGGDPSAFALGLRGSTCVLVSRYDSSRLIFDFMAEEAAVVVMGHMIAEPVAGSSGVSSAAGGSGGASSSAAETPPLHQIAQLLKHHLGLEGTIKEVLEEATVQLGIDAKGKALATLAHESWVALGCPAPE